MATERGFLIVSATVAMIVSLFFSAYLFTRAALYLWRTRRRLSGRRELVKHISGIALADSSMAAWTYFGAMNSSHSFWVTDDPRSWCGLFITVRLWLISVSALLTGLLAFSALTVLRGRPAKTRVLRHGPCCALPVSVALNAFNFWEPSHSKVNVADGNSFCSQTSRAAAIESVQQGTIFLFIVGVMFYALYRAWSLDPSSVEWQSIRIINRYLFAYTASYGFWIVARISVAGRLWTQSIPWQFFVSISWRLLSLNGAFNFAALWLHARDVSCDLEDSARARLLPEGVEASIVEVSKVDHHRLSKRAKASLAEIQNGNQRLWKELGLTYEQGVSGQLEPLTEEERADHFYSILGAGVENRLQKARI